jgi:hypothetical protein
VSIPQFGDDRDRIQPRVLRQCGWDNLQSVRIRLEAIRLHSLQSLRILREQAGDMNLGSPTASYECPANSARVSPSDQSKSTGQK